MTATARGAALARDTAAIRPFRFEATDDDLIDLRRRVSAARLPERETVADHSQGVPLATVQKELAKSALLSYARGLMRMVTANPDVEASQKAKLGIEPFQPRTPSVPPTVAPDLDVVSIAPTSLVVRVHNADTVSRRRRPDGCAGAAVWTFVGPVPPMDPLSWHFSGNFTRQNVTLNFSKVKVNYTEQTATGAPGDKPQMGWDIAANVKL